MVAIIKILLTLMVIVILLQMKVSMGNAMTVGTSLLFFLCAPQWATLEGAGKAFLFSPSTWEILLSLYLVMCLEYQLRTCGIIDGLMVVSRNFFKSDKALLILMPAILGFLPSLGGAIFSAPLVESAAKPYELSPEKKTIINYWFRHLWECTNPIIPGLLLASEIVKVPVSTLIVHMLWVSVLCLTLGWYIFIWPLKSQSINSFDDIVIQEQRNNYQYVFLGIGPMVANLLLVVGFNFGPATSMFLVVALMTFVLRLKLSNIIAMFRHAFDCKLLWGIIAIIFFQHMLNQTGIIDDVALMLKSLGISLVLIISAIAFLAGILTGNAQGYVAIAFPLIGAIATGNISMAVVGYIAGFVGVMLSPAHLCILVSADYFKANFLKSLQPVVFMGLFILLILAMKTNFNY